MFVYLHGLNSSGASSKATWLRAQLAPAPVLSPTYPAHRAPEAIARLRAFLAPLRAQHDRLLLIGSSLGGFYAPLLAEEFHAGMVLINPAVNAHLGLRRYVGPQVNESTGERYVLTDADVDAFASVATAACDPRTPTLVLIDEADEVIDVAAARALYRVCGRTIVYPGGSHRFEHLPEALPEIRALYASLVPLTTATSRS
jgi:predicted esterase YcpF (UPF0227 family)